MSLDLGKLIYDNRHKIPVVSDSESLQRDVLIKMFIGSCSTINIKIVELDNYRFNYTCHIDRSHFSRIKADQSLEINFEELQSQLLDLLLHVKNKKMSLRLNVFKNSCDMVFYEKSKLKTIIFLTIKLNVTDQELVINEISMNLYKLKDSNRNLELQLERVKLQLDEKDEFLKSALTTNKIFEHQIIKDFKSVEKLLVSSTVDLEQNFTEKMLTLSRKHIKLLNDVEIIKTENNLKCESSVRLVNSMQNLRLENECNIKSIENLKLELNHLNILRKNAEEICDNKRELLLKLENKNKSLQSEIVTLKTDLENATVIIAQKARTQEEISKDLVQANTMLVNFNNECNVLCKKLEEQHEIINNKEALLNDQSLQMKRFLEEYNKYRQNYNEDEVMNLNQEIYALRKTLEELEKQNKEANKMNDLLTRKLSALRPT